jgi:hypothetical protein
MTMVAAATAARTATTTADDVFVDVDVNVVLPPSPPSPLGRKIII